MNINESASCFTKMLFLGTSNLISAPHLSQLYLIKNINYLICTYLEALVISFGGGNNKHFCLRILRTIVSSTSVYINYK